MKIDHWKTAWMVLFFLAICVSALYVMFDVPDDPDDPTPTGVPSVVDTVYEPIIIDRYKMFYPPHKECILAAFKVDGTGTGPWTWAIVSDTVVWDGEVLVHPKFERGSVYWERRYPDTVYQPWGSHPDSCDTFYVTERR